MSRDITKRPRQDLNLRPSGYESEDARTGWCHSVPDSAVMLVFRGFTCSAGAVRYQPVTGCPLEDPLEVLTETLYDLWRSVAAKSFDAGLTARVPLRRQPWLIPVWHGSIRN